MTRQEQRREAQDRDAVLRAQRDVLEADLTHIAALIEAEAGTWAERRSAVQALHLKVLDTADGDDEAREAWYLAAHEDAQHTIVVTHGLMQRYDEISRVLMSCQQELTQLSRDHRRG